MRIAAILIGDELLDGRVSDVNGRLLARELAARGREVGEVRMLRDGVGELVLGLEQLSMGHDVVVVSGGLGATRDDLTREGLASWLNVHLVEHPAGVETVRALVAQRGHRFTDELRRHARMPAGAHPVDNPLGLALGIAAVRGRTKVFALPGVPREFAAMIPAVLAAIDDGPPASRLQRRLTLWGVTERRVEELLEGTSVPADVRLGICADDGVIDLTLTGDDAALVSAASTDVERVCSDHVVGRDMSFAEAALSALRARGETLAIAESCTGGLIGSLVTDVAGSSEVFVEGCVTYSNAAKMARLGVREATLLEHGAVSRATVLEMAHGVRATSGSAWGVATSGIAGPGGGSPEKPVGLVHLAVVGPELQRHRELHFPNRTRTQVKRRAALAALAELVRAARGLDLG